MTFLFKSAEAIVGQANNLDDLVREMERLSIEDPDCVTYHLKEQHISTWLKQELAEKELAKKLEVVADPMEAVQIIKFYMQSTRKATEHERRKPKKKGFGKKR